MRIHKDDTAFDRHDAGAGLTEDGVKHAGAAEANDDIRTPEDGHLSLETHVFGFDDFKIKLSECHNKLALIQQSAISAAVFRALQPGDENPPAPLAGPGKIRAELCKKHFFVVRNEHIPERFADH